MIDDTAFSPLAAITAVNGTYIFGEDSPCPISIEPGRLERVWVISGENAGGKSLFCKAVEGLVRSSSEEAGTPIEVMRVGMDRRTSSGIERALMFGDESRQSTGMLSVSCLLSGLETSRNRTNPHWLILDEPDIGVGEGYRAAVGELFAEFSQNLPENALGFVIVTHAREIAGPMISAGASSVRVGRDLRPVAEWIRDGDLPKTLEELKSLPKRSTELYRTISAAIREANATPAPSR